MLKYCVYADATADIPKDVQKRFKIGMLPIPVTIGDRSFMSGEELENEEFYTMLEESDTLPVTSQITPYVFEELFQKEYDAGTEELFLFLINAKGSATYNNAIAMKETFFEEHPGAKMQIRLFDGASYSAGYGYPAIITSQMLEMGMSADEAEAYARQLIASQCIYFGLYTLKYAGKSGRIPGAAVFVGEALGIKPIMKIRDHAITTESKARGEKKLVKEIVKMVASDMKPKTPYQVIYGSDENALAEMLAEMEKKVGYPPQYVFRIGPAIAINAGPKVIGVTFCMNPKKEKTKN
ncbi:MAG: DegV family protein [Clostridiales bacterium]|nr:DegV family protein [Clostridiales bacterium]